MKDPVNSKQKSPKSPTPPECSKVSRFEARNKTTPESYGLYVEDVVLLKQRRRWILFNTRTIVK